jgi:hypothetical protein
MASQYNLQMRSVVQLVFENFCSFERAAAVVHWKCGCLTWPPNYFQPPFLFRFMAILAPLPELLQSNDSYYSAPLRLR